MANQRRYLRTALRCRFKIWSDTIAPMTVYTKDISDGGVFLVMDPQEQEVPPVGTVLKGQVQGLMDDAPIVTLEVVRMVEEGIGLRFLSDTK
ncbi:PilZ domain-containing protein [Ketobacter sp.]|uniref:PilZ domain-containing protein n=1 Tax=Ketobacter sp. TaxID=2083498 RepID=UPI000F29C73E|nr:PilZ domain-containing protein [Ketobacter sp.]RLU00357.1 MAG: PilZ domain-containing protein [Ketobacter sp.]